MSASKSLDRRKFLKSSVTGVAGIFLLGAGGLKQQKTEREKEQKINRRMLGKTGIELPVVSMGVMNADNPNLVRAALDAGIVHLDTAHGYQRGRNEEMIGEVVKGRPRESFVIATKVPGEPRGRGRTLSPEEIGTEFLGKLDISLKRLGLDYVDILYVHGVRTREAALSPPLLDALARAKKEGKVRFTGVSTHSNEPEVLNAAADSKFYDVVLTAYNFKQGHLREMQEAIGKAADAGIGIIAMKTLAGGFMDAEKQQPVNPKAALKWVLQDPHVTTAIPGFTTFDQLQTDISVMEDLNLTEPEKKELQLGAIDGGFYCQGCRQCLGQCPERLPIPDLMRAHMYTYSYKNFAEARELLLSLDLPGEPCGDCRECEVKCASGFAVGEKIRDVVRMRDVPGEFFA
ncbi:MAG: aldo/keto reductase [Calditrichia bacterium]